MIIYRCRPGVVLTQICGEYLLVSSKEAREECPYVQQINGTAAFIWKQLISGASVQKVAESLLDEYEIQDKETAEREAGAFLDILNEHHYLLLEEKSDERYVGCSRKE